MDQVNTYMTEFIVGLIIVVTIILLRKFDRFSISHGPEVLTTLGIMGCFAGVAYSLWNLNTDAKQLTNSIPFLLGGMKTAFLGSLAGIFGALVLRFWQYFHRNDEVVGELTQTATLNDLVIAIKALQKGLVGSEEGTLLTQMKLQRQETNDQLTKLRGSFDGFAKHMVENNQKAIVEALEQVIKDFNNKLTEQFGENFKQLNNAVGDLVEWQQQYKETLASLMAAQQQTSADMGRAADAFSQIVERSKDFSSTAEKLKSLMESLDKQKDVLFVQEKALSELLLSMKDVTPKFSEKMNAMLVDLTNGIQTIQSNTAGLVKNFGIQTQSSLVELNNGVQAIQSTTAEIVKNYGIQTQTANAEMKELLVNVVKSTQDTLINNLKENSATIKEGVLALDKGLQTELNNALMGLGNQLTALSEKFVQDYLPLTERLREVVRIAEDLKR